MFKTWWIATIVLSSAATMGRSSFCSWTDPSSGASFDVSPMSKGRGYVIHGGGEDEIWYTNVCAQVSHKCDGARVSGPAVATQFMSNKCVSTMAVVNEPKWSLIDGGHPDKGIQVKWGGGDSCAQVKSDREVTMKIKCNRGMSATKAIKGEETSTCKYLITFEGPDGCPGGAGGGGGGWTFVILVIVGFSLYCGLGTLYNTKYHDKKGIEALPNSKFWVELPELVKIGCKYSYEQAKKLKSKYDGHYGYANAEFNDIDDDDGY